MSSDAQPRGRLMALRRSSRYTMSRLILSQAGIPLFLVAALSVAWAFLLRGVFQDSWNPELSRLTAVWKGFWVLAFPVPIAIALARASQVGRQRIETLLDRLPVRPQDALSARVFLAFGIGLPLWLMVASILVAGLPFRTWIPWLMVGTSLFCSTLLVFTSTWAASRKNTFTVVHLYILIIYGIILLTVAYLLGEAWKSPKLAEFSTVLFFVTPAIFIYIFAGRVASLNALGLQEPIPRAPWWWPKENYFHILFYLYLVVVDIPINSLLLVQQVFNSTITAWGEWRNNRNCQEADLEYENGLRKLALHLFLVAFTTAVLLYRLWKYLQLAQDPANPTGDWAKSVQGVNLQVWLLVAGFGLTFVAIVHTFQKTRDLLATLRRRDALILRLPVALAAVVYTRIQQWSHLIVAPVVSLAALDIAVLFLNDTSQHGWTWIVWMVGIQLLALTLGAFLFYSIAAPRLQRSKGRRV